MRVEKMVWHVFIETGGNGTSSVHRFRYCVKFYSSEPGTNLHEEITRYQVWPLTHVFSLLIASLLYTCYLLENGLWLKQNSSVLVHEL